MMLNLMAALTQQGPPTQVSEGLIVSVNGETVAQGDLAAVFAAYVSNSRLKSEAAFLLPVGRTVPDIEELDARTIPDTSNKSADATFTDFVPLAESPVIPGSLIDGVVAEGHAQAPIVGFVALTNSETKGPVVSTPPQTAPPVAAITRPVSPLTNPKLANGFLGHSEQVMPTPQAVALADPATPKTPNLSPVEPTKIGPVAKPSTAAAQAQRQVTSLPQLAPDHTAQALPRSEIVLPNETSARSRLGLTSGKQDGGTSQFAFQPMTSRAHKYVPTASLQSLTSPRETPLSQSPTVATDNDQQHAAAPFTSATRPLFEVTIPPPTLPQPMPKGPGATPAALPALISEVTEILPRHTKNTVPSQTAPDLKPEPSILSRISPIEVGPTTPPERAVAASELRKSLPSAPFEFESRPNPKPLPPGPPSTPTVIIPEQSVSTAIPVDPATDIDVVSARPFSADEPSAKLPPKPFAAAILSQVKNVTAQEGRTVFSLQPQGLGALEVEVVTEYDAAAKIVVRVENAMVLQTLREDRQLFAQTIGMPEGTQVEFHDNAQQSEGGDTGQRSSGSSAHTVDTRSEADVREDTHDNIIRHGAVDILT